MMALLLGAKADAASMVTHRVDVDGTAREYLLALPSRTAPNPAPLILLLHGHLGTANNALGRGTRPSPLSAWLTIADREGIMIAALQGLKGSDGRTCARRLDDAPGSP